MHKYLLLFILALSTGLNVSFAQQSLPTDPSSCILPEGAVPPTKGFGRQLRLFLWPENILPYEIETSGFTARELARIDSSIAYINEATNLCLLPRTFETSYVNLSISLDSFGSASTVGFREGRQEITLPFYATRRTHLHEFGHIAGLFHEHQRPDRDDYVTVFQSNVDADFLDAFLPYPENMVEYYQSEKYDFSSVMHFSPYTFSRNGLPTILPRDSGIVIPTNAVFSETDLATLAKIYPLPIDCDSVYRERILDGRIEVVGQLDEICRNRLVEVRFVFTQGNPIGWQFFWEAPGSEIVSSNGARAVLRLSDAQTQRVTVSIRKGAYERTFENALEFVDSVKGLEILGNPIISRQIDYRFSSANDRVRVWLTDASGRRLYNETVEATECVTQRSIDCSACSAGVYTLTVIDGQNRQSRKVLLP